MKELMLMLGEIIPTVEIVTQIKDSCDDYIKDPSEEHLKKIEAMSMLLLSKGLSKDCGGIEAALKKAGEVDDAMKLNDRIKGRTF